MKLSGIAFPTPLLVAVASDVGGPSSVLFRRGVRAALISES